MTNATAAVAPATTYTIALESVRQSDVYELIALSDAYSAERYPPEGNFALDIDSLDAFDIAFAVARSSIGAGGCVGIKFESDGTAEVKRLFVRDEARGHGLGRRLMSFIEDLARQRGVTTLNLETGPLNTEAVALYKALGFTVCGPFGPYEDNPYSLFMTRELGATA